MRQTQVLALLLRLEAVSVTVAAAVPEPDALVLNGVEEPHHGVVLAAAGVLALEAGVCTERRRRRTTPTPDWRNGRATVLERPPGAIHQDIYTPAKAKAKAKLLNLFQLQL